MVQAKLVGALRGLTSADLEAIRSAVAEAERHTGGEIVTYIVGECDSYPEARWSGAAIGTLLGVGMAAWLNHLGDYWGSPLWAWSLLPAIAGATLGLALAGAAPLRRWLVPSTTIDRRVALRAESAFLEEEVFATRERSGVLLLVALFEHRVVVLGDSGINALVPKGTWEEIVAQLTLGLREGRMVEALVRAIAECGRLLAEHDVKRRADDRDELSDAARMRER
jgi:putative membrane protein